MRNTTAATANSTFASTRRMYDIYAAAWGRDAFALIRDANRRALTQSWSQSTFDTDVRRIIECARQSAHFAFLGNPELR